MDPELYFGVSRDLGDGTAFLSTEMLSSYTHVDLKEFLNGVVVTLNYDEASNEFVFSTSQPF